MQLNAGTWRSFRSPESGRICSRCLRRLKQLTPSQPLQLASVHTERKLHAAITSQRSVPPQTFIRDYFSANNSIDRGWVKNGALAAWRSIAESPRHKSTERQGILPSSLGTAILQEKTEWSRRGKTESQPLQPVQPVAVTQELPHRRRRRLKRENEATEAVIPPDASSQLTTAAANMPSSASFRRSFASYLSLTKPRLSFLMTLTATTTYSLYPIPDILSSTTSLAPTTLSTTTLTLAYLTTGTFLSSACANTLNMMFEPKYDAMMTRTRNRPLVRKLVTLRAAGVFAFVCGASGLTLLYLGTNPTVATLSAINIFLYAGVYTPMKRISVANTWIGALVGGIPPLMGWAAGAGQVATSEHHSWQDLLLTEEAIGGWLMAALLFAWQFPHFNSIAHSIKDEYKNAGYKMLAWTNPARSGRVAVRYSLMLFPVCVGLWYVGVVNSGFVAISAVCNVWMTREAVKFWRRGGAGGSARGLFWASVWYLPLVMAGSLICKTGIWEGVWKDGLKAATEKDDEDEDLEDNSEVVEGLLNIDLDVES